MVTDNSILLVIPFKIEIMSLMSCLIGFLKRNIIIILHLINLFQLIFLLLFLKIVLWRVTHGTF